jgi:hypothetical protein
MRLVTASAKNHSRIRRSDSASAITIARAERLGRLATNERGMLFVQAFNCIRRPDRFPLAFWVPHLVRQVSPRQAITNFRG